MIGCKDPEKFINWYSDCVKFGLLVESKGKFSSPALSEVMESWEAKKINGSKGGRPKKIKTEIKPKRKLNETETKPNIKGNHNHKRIEENIIEESKNAIHDSTRSALGVIVAVTGKEFICQLSVTEKELMIMGGIACVVEFCTLHIVPRGDDKRELTTALIVQFKFLSGFLRGGRNLLLVELQDLLKLAQLNQQSS